MIRLVLAEDQAMVRGALAALLQLEGDFDVVGTAADGVIALDMVERLQPDLLVTDIEMPNLSGLDLAARLRERNLSTRVVIVTTFARAGYLRRALDAGVRGYLLKDAPSSKLGRGAARSPPRRPLDRPGTGRRSLARRSRPTDRTRTRRAADWPEKASDSAEIGERLHLSAGTVRNYLSEAIGKLGASNRIEAYRLAQQKGLAVGIALPSRGKRTTTEVPTDEPAQPAKSRRIPQTVRHAGDPRRTRESRRPVVRARPRAGARVRTRQCQHRSALVLHRRRAPARIDLQDRPSAQRRPALPPAPFTYPPVGRKPRSRPTLSSQVPRTLCA